MSCWLCITTNGTANSGVDASSKEMLAVCSQGKSAMSSPGCSSPLSNSHPDSQPKSKNRLQYCAAEPMLPNLSDRWGAKLQVLLPAASESSSVSAGQNALVELKKIDSIRVSVSGKGSKARFAVEVSMESPTTSGCLGLSAAPTEPTIRIERELFEFKDVSNTLHDLVDSAHRGERCQLCSAILNWFVFGENPDGFLLAFASKERVARKLQKFLDDLSAVTIQHTSTDPQGCSAQTLIPRAVHEFLFGPPAA